jgi:hypothetical protein
VGLYNTTGRGFPDVAAQAEVVEIAWSKHLSQAPVEPNFYFVLL